MNLLRDEFLSEEDLDLRNLSEAEFLAYWNAWLVQAQTTNDADAHVYAHGVFSTDRPRRDPGGAIDVPSHRPEHRRQERFTQRKSPSPES